MKPLLTYSASLVTAAGFAFFMRFVMKGSDGSLVMPLALIVFVPVVWVLLRRGRDRAPGTSGSAGVHAAILASALLYGCVVQSGREDEARQEVDAVVAALHEHRARQGGCPKDLGEIGFDARTLRSKWYLGYHCADGKPALFYSSPAVLLSAWHYDFEAREWRRAD